MYVCKICLTLQYGPIAHIDLKIPPRPPGYAFVEVIYLFLILIYFVKFFFKKNKNYTSFFFEVYVVSKCLFSLKRLVMLRMLSGDVMAMILMGIGYGLVINIWQYKFLMQLVVSSSNTLFVIHWSSRLSSHTVDVVIHRQQTAIVIMVVVVAEAEAEAEAVEDVEACLGGPIIVVSLIPPGTDVIQILSMVRLINLFYFNYLVMVSGLPSSASWQDLKVRFDN